MKSNFHLGINSERFFVKEDGAHYALHTFHYIYQISNQWNVFSTVLKKLKKKEYSLDLSRVPLLELRLLDELALLGLVTIEGMISGAKFCLYFKKKISSPFKEKKLSKKKLDEAVITHEKNLFWVEFPLSQARISFKAQDLNTLAKSLASMKLQTLLAHFLEGKTGHSQLHSHHFYSHVNPNIFNEQVGLRPEVFTNIYLPDSKLNPLDEHEALSDFDKVVSARRSRRASDDKPFKSKSLSTLLSSVFQKIPESGYPNGFRGIYPSAGGFYEISPLIEILNHEDLPQGLYKVDIQAGQVNYIPLKEKAVRRTKYVFGNPKVIIHLIGDIKPLEEKYKGLPLKVLYQNSGVIISYLYLYAAKNHLPCVANGAEVSSYQIEKVYPYDEGFLHVGQFLLV